jgi:1,2-dihydroxy-3-keto-5-methylthiopentene dioxygenase
MTYLTVYAATAPYQVRSQTADVDTIAAALAPMGIVLERWQANVELSGETEDAAIINAYRADIDRLMARGNYQSCDVIRLQPDNPQRDVLRTKFLDEHTHADDEVRFFVEGSGVFYIHGPDAIYALECTRDDLIVVPKGTHHWFDMGPAPRFTAIRLFTGPEGWVATFTGDPIAKKIPLYEGAA